MNEAERYLHEFQNKPVPLESSGDPSNSPGFTRPPGTHRPKANGVFAGWWSLEGRLGRQTYLLRLLCIFGAMILFGVVLTVVAAIAGADEWLGRPIGALVVFSSMPFALPQHTRRLHDLGWSGWWQMLLLVPAFGLIFRIYLWCKLGTPGRNPYGQSVA